MLANLENATVVTGLEKVCFFFCCCFVFFPKPKERPCQRMFQLLHSCTLSHSSKGILEILQARLQQYMNCELPDVQAGFRKGRGTRDQIANSLWIIKKAREFQKNIYVCLIDYTTAFDGVDHKQLCKILKEN